MDSQLNVLLIEDDASLSATLVKYLSTHNDVKAVANLEQARIVLNNSQFDVVLLDKGLPDGNGISLIPEIKKSKPATAIIVMTGDSEFNSVTKSISAGADDYIIKSESLVPELFVRMPVAVNYANLKLRNKMAEAAPDLKLPQTASDLSSERYVRFMRLAEKSFLSAALKLCGGDAAHTAQAIGIAKSTMFKKMSELDLPRRAWQRSYQMARQVKEITN